MVPFIGMELSVAPPIAPSLTLSCMSFLKRIAFSKLTAGSDRASSSRLPRPRSLGLAVTVAGAWAAFQRDKMTSASYQALFTEFGGNPPAEPVSIAECQSHLAFPLPDDYMRFLRLMNGGEGFIGNDHYLMLWRVEDLIRLNSEYHLAEACTELFLFGSNGGSEAFAFDTYSTLPPVVAIPYIGLSFEDAILIAPTFELFLRRLYHSKSLFGG